MDRFEHSTYDYDRIALFQKSTVLVNRKREDEARDRLAVSAFRLHPPHVPADGIEEDQTEHL